MCSISGIITTSSVESNRVDLKTAVARMNEALRHRGPDDEGIVEYGSTENSSNPFSLCLGNTRLAIIDISSAGHQPMVDIQTGTCITYNGETYNFRELKREIGDEFGPWDSTTDTEVVLRAYRKWGVDGFKKLRGMFAVAIWDQPRQRLVLARDHFGIKPLYYYISYESRSFLFSSEVRALLASGLVSRRLSRQGLASFLSYGSTQAPLTIIDGVKALMPGESMIIRPGDGRLHCETISIKTAASSTRQFASRSDAADALRTKLQESVNAHLVSDVPLGVFLSGGLDSSSLVALISKAGNEKPRTFSIAFDDAKYNEAPHSRLISNSFKTNHHEILIDEGELLRLLPSAIQSFDQPSMDGVNTFVVSKAVKDAGVTVALSGLGGDELFAGYPSFRRALRMQSISPIAKRMLRFASPAGKLAMNGSVRRNKFWQLAMTEGTSADVYRITRQLFDPKTVSALNGAAYQEDFERNDELTDPINQMSAFELQGYMANTLLRDTDSMSMAHSLEVRVPFVDVDVVQFAFSVPGKLKLNGEAPHVSKPLLADAMRNLLPPEFVQRRKMGFTIPFERWMQSQLKNEIDEVLSDRDRFRNMGIDFSAVATVWNRFLKSPGSVGWSRPWSLYVLAKWCEISAVTSAGSSRAVGERA